MTRRNTPLEVEQVEQLALIARLLPHHGESPSLISQADGITVRRFSRALFQQHRSNSEVIFDLEHVRFDTKSGNPRSPAPSPLAPRLWGLARTSGLPFRSLSRKYLRPSTKPARSISRVLIDRKAD